jgi:hypothetical protein
LTSTGGGLDDRAHGERRFSPADPLTSPGFVRAAIREAAGDDYVDAETHTFGSSGLVREQQLSLAPVFLIDQEMPDFGEFHQYLSQNRLKGHRDPT